jgi:hypothetical protein
VSTNKSFIVPRNNNSHLLYPLSEPADGLLSYNLGLQVDSPRWLQDLRVLARIEALEEAQNFDNWCGYLDTSTSRKTTATKPKRWLVGGHQPELFHPGVWFKNYLLAGISQKLSANGSACQPLHVIIDHDLAKADTIKTIYEKAGKLVVRNNVLPFRSLAHPPLPWQSTYLEPSMLPDWQDVVNSVEQDCISQGWEPILSTRFSVLERCISTNKSVGDAFSLLRRSVELSCGIENSEVRMSQLCERSAFGEFVFRCLSESTRLIDAYNLSRDEFRRRRKIRNAAQPVPELQSQAGWVEMPFWIYRARRAESEILKDHYRSKLWFSQSARGSYLSNSPSQDASILLRVPDDLALDIDTGRCHQVWNEWCQQGICIRPRALMTTLFLRFVLSDLFVHGVGGGLYDSVTDEIACRLWGVTAPKMIVASATLHLPIVEPAGAVELDERKLNDQLRWLRSSPERFLDLRSPTAQSLWTEHESLIANIPRGHAKAEWHDRMASLRTKIHATIHEESESIEAASSKLIQQRHQKAICSSREYSFSIFSERDITSRLRKVVDRAVAATDDRTGK